MTKLTTTTNTKARKTPNPFQKLSISNPFNQKILKNVHSLFKQGHTRSHSTELKKNSKDVSSSLSLFKPTMIDTGITSSSLSQQTTRDIQTSYIGDPDSNEYPLVPISSQLGEHNDSTLEELCASPSDLLSPDQFKDLSVLQTHYVERVETVSSPGAKHLDMSAPRAQGHQVLTSSLKQYKTQQYQHQQRVEGGSPVGIPKSESFRGRDQIGTRCLKNPGVKRINSMYANQKDIKSISKISTASVPCISSLLLDKSGSLPALQGSGIPTYQLGDIERDEIDSDNNLFGGPNLDSSNDMFPRINVNTLFRIMSEGIHQGTFDSYLIIDCRFAYEFEGGHIEGAINLSSQADVRRELIYNRVVNNPSYDPSKRTLLIFHCEFSSYRGPILASYLRNFDRILNHNNYPGLFYPDILILDKGYKNFYDTYPELCSPSSYVGMNSMENVAECKLQLDKFRRESKRVVTRSNSLREISDMVQASCINSNQPITVTTLGDKIDDVRDSPELTAFKFELPPKLSYRDSIISNNSRSSSNRSSALLPDILSVTTVSSGGGANMGSKLLSIDSIPFDPFVKYEDFDGSEISLGNTRVMSPSNRLTFYPYPFNELDRDDQ